VFEVCGFLRVGILSLLVAVCVCQWRVVVLAWGFVSNRFCFRMMHFFFFFGKGGGGGAQPPTC